MLSWNNTEAVNQIPHAFQQLLSFESTPTLCDAIPAYGDFESAWKEYQSTHSEVAPFIQRGLDKLEIYRERLDLVPAYALALSMLFYMLIFSKTILTHFIIVLNPSEKLNWYYENQSLEKVQEVKELFLREVSNLSIDSYSHWIGTD